MTHRRLLLCGNEAFLRSYDPFCVHALILWGLVQVSSSRYLYATSFGHINKIAPYKSFDAAGDRREMNVQTVCLQVSSKRGVLLDGHRKARRATLTNSQVEMETPSLEASFSGRSPQNLCYHLL